MQVFVCIILWGDDITARCCRKVRTVAFSASLTLLNLLLSVSLGEANVGCACVPCEHSGPTYIVLIDMFSVYV